MAHSQGASMIRVRQAEVFISEISNNVDRYVTRITLPAAPWEDGQDLGQLIAHRAAIRQGQMAGETCAFPGCNATLKHDNTSGVCSVHVHAKGACRCKTCRRSSGKVVKV